MYESYAIIRDKRGYRDADIAKMTGIAKSTFSEWKSGRSQPKLDKLYAIARVLRVDVNMFFHDFTPEAVKRMECTAKDQDETDLLMGYRASSPEMKKSIMLLAREALKKGNAEQSYNSAHEETA